MKNATDIISFLRAHGPQDAATILRRTGLAQSDLDRMVALGHVDVYGPAKYGGPHRFTI